MLRTFLLFCIAATTLGNFTIPPPDPCFTKVEKCEMQIVDDELKQERDKYMEKILACYDNAKCARPATSAPHPAVYTGPTTPRPTMPPGVTTSRMTPPPMPTMSAAAVTAMYCRMNETKDCMNKNITHLWDANYEKEEKNSENPMFDSMWKIMEKQYNESCKDGGDISKLKKCLKSEDEKVQHNMDKAICKGKVKCFKKLSNDTVCQRKVLDREFFQAKACLCSQNSFEKCKDLDPKSAQSVFAPCQTCLFDRKGELKEELKDHMAEFKQQHKEGQH